MRDLFALTRLARVPLARVLAAVLLGAVAVLAGVGLMGLAGYVISRAAEHPPVLALGVAIVGVRAFGITRPVARYGERLVSHDLAFRVLARMRVVVYRRLEPQVPSRTAQRRQGDLLAALVGDVDATQNLYLRGFAPPLVAVLAGVVCVAVATVLLPAAGAALAVGLVVAGVAVPLLATALQRRDGARRTTLRAELSTELVELLRGAPEIVAMGREEDALARVDRLDGQLRRLGRSDAVASAVVEGLLVAVTGLTSVVVLWLAVRATSAGGSTAPSSPRWCSARSRPSTPSRRCRPRRWSCTRPPRRPVGCSRSPMEPRRWPSPQGRHRRRPAPTSSWTACASTTATRRHGPSGTWTFGCPRARGSRSSVRPEQARARSPRWWCASSTPTRVRSGSAAPT